MVKEKFGDRLKRLRERAGVSKYRLAIVTGINESYIYQLESNAVESPRGDTLLLLAKGLNVPVEELMGITPEMLDKAKRMQAELAPTDSGKCVV